MARSENLRVSPLTTLWVALSAALVISVQPSKRLVSLTQTQNNPHSHREPGKPATFNSLGLEQKNQRDYTHLEKHVKQYFVVTLN